MPQGQVARGSWFWWRAFVAALIGVFGATIAAGGLWLIYIRAADWRPGFGHNDLEPVAVARFPEVGESLRWLERFAPARMTGSGACVFAEFATRAAAETAAASLTPAWNCWVAAGLARHPLADL